MQGQYLLNIELYINKLWYISIWLKIPLLNRINFFSVFFCYFSSLFCVYILKTSQGRNLPVYTFCAIFTNLQIRWKYVFVYLSFKNSSESIKTGSFDTCVPVHTLIDYITIQMFLNLEVLNLSFLFTKQMDLLCTNAFKKKDNTVCLLWIFVFVCLLWTFVIVDAVKKTNQYYLYIISLSGCWCDSFLCCRLCLFFAEWSQVATAAAAVAVAVISAAGNGSRRIPRRKENTQIYMYVV